MNLDPALTVRMLKRLKAAEEEIVLLKENQKILVQVLMELVAKK